MNKLWENHIFFCSNPLFYIMCGFLLSENAPGKGYFVLADIGIASERTKLFFKLFLLRIGPKGKCQVLTIFTMQHFTRDFFSNNCFSF